MKKDTINFTELVYKILLPVSIEFIPQKDITAYELAKLLPLLTRHSLVMPYELPEDELLLRHLKIRDPNKS